MTALEELNLLRSAHAFSSVLVLYLEDLWPEYHRIAQAFRAAGISAEVYPDKKKLAVQFAYAEKRGIPLAIVCGAEEAKAGTMGVKDLRIERALTYKRAAAIDKAKELLR